MVRGWLIEQCIWCIPTILFFSYSILVLGQSKTAVVPHLITVFGFFLSFTTTRAVTAKHLSTFISVIHGLAVAVLIAIYIACVIGYSHWGRIPTLSMLKPYINHSDELLKTLEVSPIFANVLITTYIGGITFLCIFITKYSGWSSSVKSCLSTTTRTIFFVAGISSAFFSYLNVVDARYAQQQEPITVMIYGTTLIQQSASRHKADELARLAREKYVPTGIPPSRNVILIVGDALRPSRMNMFGASRLTTPNLNKIAVSETLAYKGTVTTSCAESFCGLVSLSRSSYAHTVSKNDMTLAEVLGQHGYQHKLVLGGDHTNFYGLKDWLGQSEHYWDGTYSNNYTNDDRAVVAHLRSMHNYDGNPELIQIHLMSTHALGTRERSSQNWAPAHNYYRSAGFGKTESALNLEMINYYDNGMLQFDSKVSEILDILKEKAYLDDALVIITGDHGEMLGEHNLYAHGNGVYQPVLEVPLIMFRFGHDGQTYAANNKAAHIDISPTVLSELNLPIPERWLGAPLNKLKDRRFLFFEHHNEIGLKDFSSPNQIWKYWFNKETGQEFAFELNSDPGELRNRVLFIPNEMRTQWRDALQDSLEANPMI